MDMQYEERFEFHEWHLEKYGDEYPFTYSEMFKILTNRENQEEKENLQRLVNEFTDYNTNRKVDEK